MIPRTQLVSPRAAARQLTDAMISNKRFALDIIQNHGITGEITPDVVREQISSGYINPQGQLVLIG